MIKHALSRSTGPRLEIMQTATRYEIDGAPRLDLIDARGQLHEAAEILTPGSTTAHLSAVPEEGADVLTLTTPGGAPYVLGTASSSRHSAEHTLSEAGEYDTDAPALGDVRLSAAEAALVVSAKEGAVYISPRLRTQGRLEVSDGAAPTQSAAVGELTLSALDAHQATLEALIAATAQLQRLAALAFPPALEAEAALKITEAAALTQAGDLVGAAQATAEAAELTAAAAEAQTLTPPSPPTPPARAIISEILKLER